MIVRAIAWTVATWFGCGRSPVAPGTVGTLGAVPLYLLAARGGPLAVGGAAVATAGLGVWASSVVARERGIKDPQLVVVDEVAGYLVTMIPLAATWSSVLAGFAMFRLLDVTKPGPVRAAERLPGGWGIVLDDVVAGAIGAVVLGALRASGLLR